MILVEFFTITVQTLELWYLMPLSKIYQLYRGGKFYWWRKQEYPEKTTDLPQVRQTLSPVVSSKPYHERDLSPQH